MPWSDLSAVTNTLTRLLEINIEQVISPGLNITVVGTPPDQLGISVSNTLSLYLYHVRETAETINLPGPGSDRPNIATASMGLELFYVLTAHQRTNTTFDSEIEQRLMGYALKTLHDIPVITDATEVNLQQIITGVQRGRGNRLNIELRKLEPESSFAIWTTGERQFARLAAYYQVGLVMLEPEPARTMPGIVLSLGAFVTPLGTVSLTGTHSALSFALPAIAGGGTQTLRAEPARPAVTAPPGPHSAFTIRGVNVSAGLRRQIVLRNARWGRLTPPVDAVPLDLALNAANGWTANFFADRIEVQLGSQVTFTPAGGGPNQTITVFPGIYAVQLDTVVNEQMVAGTLRAMSARSNEIAFQVTPRITGHALIPATSRIRIDIDPAFLLDIVPPAGEELDIQVVIDGQVYQRRPAGQPPPGEFLAQPNSVLIGASFPLAQPGLHSVRLSVEGADAQPYWIETP